MTLTEFQMFGGTEKQYNACVSVAFDTETAILIFSLAKDYAIQKSDTYWVYLVDCINVQAKDDKTQIIMLRFALRIISLI